MEFAVKVISGRWGPFKTVMSALWRDVGDTVNSERGCEILPHSHDPNLLLSPFQSEWQYKLSFKHLFSPRKLYPGAVFIPSLYPSKVLVPAYATGNPPTWETFVSVEGHFLLIQNQKHTSYYYWF